MIEIAPPIPPDVLNGMCPSQRVLELVTSKWSVLVLYALRLHTLGYAQLERKVGGISQKMLTQTLRDLERHGLISRTLYPVVPPRTEYQLTELGHSLEDVVYQIGHWAETHMLEVLAAKEQYDARG